MTTQTKVRSTEEALKLALEALESNKQNHNYCEDTWYSCPKHEDGCANEAEGDECNCGADEINAQFDKAITAIKEALNSPNGEAQPEQRSGDINLSCKSTQARLATSWGYVKAEPLTEQEIVDLCDGTLTTWEQVRIARAIEAAHGIKGDA